MSLQWLARARGALTCLAVAAVLRVGWLGALARSPDLLSRLLWGRHARQSACLPRAGRCLRHAPAWPTRASSVCHERAWPLTACCLWRGSVLSRSAQVLRTWSYTVPYDQYRHDGSGVS